jgi:hypothetical protein
MRLLVLASRGMMRIAAKVVPAEHAAAWEAGWRGNLWHWMLSAASRREADSASALWSHTSRAVRQAFALRFQDEATIEAFYRFRGRPATCLSLCFGLALVLAVSTAGFSTARRLSQGWLHGLPYRGADRLALLRQGPPALGLRLGFRDSDMEILRSRPDILDGVASYVWYATWINNNGKRGPDIAAANVSPGFFRVLGVTPLVGRGLDRVSIKDGAEPFLASFQFWQKDLIPSGGRIGQRYEIGGHTMWLAGVLPADFWFLAPDTAIWTARAIDPPPPPRMGAWNGFKGTVARLQPGVSNEQAEKELRKTLVANRTGLRGYGLFVSGVSTLVFQGASIYAGGLALALTALLLCAAAGLYRGRRRGARWALTLRYWGFFLLKSAIPLAAIALWAMQGEGVSTFAITARGWWGRELFFEWAGLCGGVMVLLWAWRDQRSRCRVCLERMRQPVRIGIPGHMLLDTAGLEVMCPRGHGAVYTSESVLGADMSDRWIGFEDELTRMSGDT